MKYTEKLFDAINGGDCVDSASLAQDMLEGAIKTLNHLYLYANVSHGYKPRDYKEVIDNFKKKYQKIADEIDGVL